MEHRSFLGRLGGAILRIITVILLLALVMTGVWFYQQNKINKLNSQITDLNRQADELKKNGSLSQSLTGEFEAMDSVARDTERQTDIKAIHGQVEAYYAQNGKYPTLTDINDPAWRSTNMKGLDESILKDPEGTKAILDPKPSLNVYAYDVTATDKSTCNNATKNCVQYTLTATLANGQAFTKQSLN